MTRPTLLALSFAAALLAAHAGCSTSGEAGVACQSAGGQCFIGTYRPFCGSIAPSSEQDCNPHDNAGGGFCCLVEPDAAVAAPDGGGTDGGITGDAAADADGAVRDGS